MAPAERARPIGSAGEPFGFERLPVFALAVTMIAALAAPALGIVAVLVHLAAFAAIVAIGWRRMPAMLALAVPLLLLPIFAVASALWSDVPAISLRYGAQLVVTVLMGVVLARMLSLRQLVLAVFIGTSIACLAGLGSGRVGASADGAVLIGLAGSKNQMGYIALFWLASALCVLASGAHRLPTRIAAGIAVVPASFLIVQGDSATALVSAVVMAAMLGLLAVASWLGRGGRLFALAAAALLTVPLVVALPQIEREAAIIRTDVLNKDARLTGRTLLWESADSLIRQAPVIGHGYKAIWLGPKGKGLLARNHQTDGRAFHFHDTFRELRVDLGMVGLVLFLLPLGFAALRCLPLLLAKVDAPRAFAVVSLAVILLRIRTELVIGPFMIETVLLYALIAALASLPLGAAHSASSRPSPRLTRPRTSPERSPA
ncbi:MAG: hypothetical protein GC147_07950 [Porphyrobacter sp.]|nr:hypothetical protein [Porphyrobacter sp.]